MLVHPRPAGHCPPSSTGLHHAQLFQHSGQLHFSFRFSGGICARDPALLVQRRTQGTADKVIHKGLCKVLPTMAGCLISATTELSTRETRCHQPEATALSPGGCGARGLGHKLTGRGRTAAVGGSAEGGASWGWGSPPAGVSCSPGADEWSSLHYAQAHQCVLDRVPRVAQERTGGHHFTTLKPISASWTKSHV